VFQLLGQRTNFINDIQLEDTVAFYTGCEIFGTRPNSVVFLYLFSE
jgi:hypothetical protein